MASQLNDITDLSKLDSLDVDEILQQLKQRFYKGNIYVSISKTNVFINHVL
jgi:myosin heavy subunit